MTPTVSKLMHDRIYWGLAVASGASGALLLTPGSFDAFRMGVAGTFVLAATCIAIGDSRTGLLRNAWTGPFAAAALLQVLIATLALPDESGLMTTAVVALLVNAGAYTAMGLVGWVGFGDVKFVVGLTLSAALLAGWAAILIPPVALLVAAGTHVTPAQESQTSRPHGPALVLAFILILGTASFSGMNR